MKHIPIRLTVLISLASLIVMMGMTSVSHSEPTDTAAIFARITSPTGAYVVSFAADKQGANTLFDGTTLPSSIIPDSLSVTQDGKWMFGYGVWTTHPTFDHIYYTPLGDALPPQAIDGWWPTLSGDSRYLFYAGLDTTGMYETFNVRNLATGAITELMAARLPQRMMRNQLPPGMSLPKYLVPMANWTPGHLLFTNYVAYPCCPVDIRGFASIDLTGIKFDASKSYDLPPIKPIATVARRTSAGVLSHDGNYFAYIFLPDDKGNASVYFENGNSVAIYNLLTDSVSTFTVDDDERVRYIDWRDGSQHLIYYVRVGDGWRIGEYDLTSKTRRTLSEHPTADDVRLCGDWSFETRTNAGRRSQTVYSVQGTQNTPTALFSADRIDLLSCAPTAKWDSANVNRCDPFCTPTPVVVVGKDADVRKLDLSGGDAVKGKQLYEANGCVSCHSVSGIGGATDGMYARILNERMNDPANAGLTPEQFIAQSIIQPAAYLAKNQPNFMPDYFGDQFTLGELRDLIAFLKTQR